MSDHTITITSDGDVEPDPLENVDPGQVVRITNATDGEVVLTYPEGHPFVELNDCAEETLDKGQHVERTIRSDVARGEEYEVDVSCSEPESSPRIRIITSKRTS